MRKGGIVKTLKDLGVDVQDHGDIPFNFTESDVQYGKAKNPRTVGTASKMVKLDLRLQMQFKRGKIKSREFILSQLQLYYRSICIFTKEIKSELLHETLF